MTWAFKRLRHKEYFPTTDLQMEIRKAPCFPEEQEPVLTQRFPPARENIILMSLHNDASSSKPSTSLLSEDEWMTART
jgi:hypothetical protein